MPKFVIAGYIEAGQKSNLVKYNELNDKHWPFAFKCNAFNINKDIIAPFDTALNEADLIVNADAIAQDASYNKVEEIMSLTVNGTKFYNRPFSNIRSMCTDLPQNFDHVVGDLLKNQQYFTAIAFRENMQSSIRLLGFIVFDKLENTFNKKISKKVARQVAVKQTKSPTKDATCKSCGKKGHWNRRSKDCLNTTWKKKEPSAYYQVGTTVKTKLASVCRHARLVSGIRELVDYNSKLVYIGSMFMNFLLLHLLEQGNAILVLDSAFVYSCLSLLAGQGSQAPENLKNALVEFKRLLDWNDDIQSRLDSTGFMQVVSYVAKQYETSLRLHIVSHYFKCSKRLLLGLIYNSRSPFYVDMTLQKRKAIVDFIIAKKADPTSDFPSSIKQSADLRKIIDGLLQFWKQNEGEAPHQDVEKKVAIMENKPANSATKAYVRRRLCISPLKDSFSKNQFNSLAAATQRCIHNKLPFDDPSAYKKLKHMSSRDVEAVQKLIKNTIEYIKKEGIFQPEKYTDPKGSRFFSLLPLAQVSNRHVTLTVREIIALAIKAGVAIPRPKEDKEGKLLFHRCFYLRKAGIRLNFAARDFRYTLTTDGYSCCSFMEKRVKKKMKADAIKPSRVTAKVADSIVWGIDPGLHSVFTAVDQQETIRTTSANEYYQRSGNTTFRNSLQRLQQQQPDDHAFVEALPTLKTSNLDDFMRSVAIRLQNLDRMRRFYAVLPKWRFKRYRSKQQTLNEMSNQLIGASRKYHPDTMQNHNVTIAFGDAGFSAKPGTRRLGGVKALRERLTADAMASRGWVLYFKTDEYLTSQVCNTCSTRTLGNIK